MHAQSRNQHAACACQAGPFSLAGTKRKYERSRPFIVEHLALDLDIKMKERGVSGSAKIDFRRRAPEADSLVLDAVGFAIESVSLLLDKAKTSRQLSINEDFEYDGQELKVFIGTKASRGQLLVNYSAVPRLGLYFLSPDKAVPQRPTQVWSQCQDEDGRHFFPCQDKPHVKMTYEMKVRVPNGYTALSGGRLLSSKKSKGVWHYHFKLDVPTPAYLMTLCVGKFDEYSEKLTLPSGRVIPLRYLVPVGKLAEGKRAFSRTKAMISLFSERFGVEYAWESYAQVVVADFIFGGMENTTATTMYEHILLDKRAELDIESHDLVAHELAHQWFGDLVTCRDWSHAWLNEGFATYSELVERRARLGEDEYQHGVAEDLGSYLAEASGNYTRPIVCRDYDQPIDLFDRHLYQKGGLVLHMLRAQLGDDIFWQGVAQYLEKHRGGIVETNDLMRSLEESSGLSLEGFFDQWVYRPGHPELQVNVSYDRGQLLLQIEQKQTGKDVAVFDLPFEVEIHTNGKVEKLSQRSDESIVQISLACAKRPDFIVFDPEFKICAPLKLNAPADLLQEQLKSAPSARGRAQAAVALKGRQDFVSVACLSDSLKSEDELWMVRAIAADSLGKTGAREAFETLREAATAEHPKVRKAVAIALRLDEQAVSTLTKMTRDPSYLVTAAACRSLGDLEAPNAEKVLKPLLKKPSWADVVNAAALDGLCRAGAKSAEELAIEQSRYGNSLRSRRQAIASLGQLGKSDKAKVQLRRLLLDKDPHLRATAVASIERLGLKEATPDLQALEDRELNGWVIRRVKEALTTLLSAPPAQSNKKLAALENELRKIKARLSRIEKPQSEVTVKKATAKKATAKKATAKKATAKKATAKKATASRSRRS